MAETDAAAVISPNVSTAVTYIVQPATTSGAANQVFNPLQGYRISDPLILPGTPVTGSVVRWSATTPASGSTVTVQTSINNGASWDTAINNGPVPRLQPGDTTTLQVLTKVTLTRVFATDATPRVQSLELQVSCDSSVDELVPIAYGPIIKVETITTGGSVGGGSSSSGGTGNGITSTGGGQTGGGTSIKISGVDPSRAISRNGWQQPFTIPSGMNYGAAVAAMVTNRLPTQTAFSIASTQFATPLLVYGVSNAGDPWQDIQDLATAIGFEAFFDPTGTFVFRPIPDPRRGNPVWTFNDDANPTVVEANRQLSDEQTYNYVVVIGASTSTANPVSAFALDNDPSSPTYINGPYGTVPTRLTFPLITTQDQAQATANALLLNSLGAADMVTLTCVPNPALEPGDIVAVTVEATGATGTYMVNSMTTPLSPASAQQLTCFRQSNNI